MNRRRFSHTPAGTRLWRHPWRAHPVAAPLDAAEALTIVAPAKPGGGWDQTARALEASCRAPTRHGGQVENMAGAGGTVGLAQLVNR